MVVKFLRAKFICIIWTIKMDITIASGSWGLSLFVLFEPQLGEKLESAVLEG